MICSLFETASDLRVTVLLTYNACFSADVDHINRIVIHISSGPASLTWFTSTGAFNIHFKGDVTTRPRFHVLFLDCAWQKSHPVMQTIANTVICEVS